VSTAVADWYARFFTELPNEFWRRAAPPETARAVIDFVEAQSGLPAVARRSSTSPAAVGGTRSRPAGPRARCGHLGRGRHPRAPRGRRRRSHRDVPPGRHACRPDRRIVRRRALLGNSFGYLDPPGTRAFVTTLAGAVRHIGDLLTAAGSPPSSVTLIQTAAPSRCVPTDCWSSRATGERIRT
jgi:hypothetical protein